MNWDTVVSFQSAALLRVVAGLWAAAGLVPGVCVPTLKRHVRAQVMRYLRSAESATRRLILVRARDIVIPPPPPKSGGLDKPRTDRRGPRSAPGAEEKSSDSAPTGQDNSDRIRAFRLIDPRKFFPELYPNGRVRRGPKLFPRIRIIGDMVCPALSRIADWSYAPPGAATGAARELLAGSWATPPTTNDQIHSQAAGRHMLAIALDE